MRLLALTATMALFGAAAHAQTAAELRAAVFAPAATPATAPPIRLAPAHAPPARPEGVAKTAVDARFARDRMTGALGFLCGLDERLDREGAMSAFGSDPAGRFVGAQLKVRLP